jgi:predicted glycosyltransferase
MPEGLKPQESMSRLDLLVYAHDGRGLGHVSRSMAVAMAARRLYPHWRVLLLSGERSMEMLSAGGCLDWVKLPAYATRVVGGVSRGRSGPSRFDDDELGRLRGGIIADLVARLRPRCVLADHQPQGKHRELLPALSSTASPDTRWILGLRAVVGDVEKVWSQVALDCFRGRYRGALWYGDSTVLGTSTLERFEARFALRPVETGYVSRLRELVRSGILEQREAVRWAGTVSIPWVGEMSGRLLEALAGALEALGERFGAWRVYVGFGRQKEVGEHFHRRFREGAACRLLPIGEGYLTDLLHSRTALIYGGYNSLTDVLFTGVPGVAVLRGMQDGEQARHLERLARLGSDGLTVLEESAVTTGSLTAALVAALEKPRRLPASINLVGAEGAARCLAAWMQTQDAPAELRQGPNGA